MIARSSEVPIKRAYDPPARNDGKRVLVDRLWPRGLSREAAALDLWLKEIAPSTELRKWFGHDPDRWEEFQRRYEAELGDAAAPAVDQLLDLLKDGPVTLIYGARDTEHNDAVVLADFLRRRSRTDQRSR